MSMVFHGKEDLCRQFSNLHTSFAAPPPHQHAAGSALDAIPQLREPLNTNFPTKIPLDELGGVVNSQLTTQQQFLRHYAMQ